MIRVLFIVPYPDLESDIYKVYQEGSISSKLHLKVAVKTVDQLESIKLEYDVKSFDVLVARGYSAIRLKELYPEVPVVTIDISAFDIIQSIYSCKQKYGAKKIALIGEFSAHHNFELLQEVLKCDIKMFYAKKKDIKVAVRAAINQGYDAIVGGYSVILESKAYNYPAILIKTGSEAIQIALKEAVNIGEALKLEKEKSQMFKNVAESATDGIVYLKKDGSVEILNQTAKKILDQFNPGSTLEGITFIKDGLEKITGNKSEKDSLLYSNNDITLSVEYLPVVIQGQVEGAVIHFQNVTRIQELENRIRRKLSDRGLNAKYTFKDIIYESEEMAAVINQAISYAKVDSNVIIFGESGTGKELIAHSIHNESSRRLQPFVAVNCAAIPENLLESELFGYSEGAFTDAKKGGKMGLFELAHNGTLFLDEISELPMGFQSKLLRAIQEREVRRVGDNKTISVNVRIIAATNVNLNRLVKNGKFRLDLLYRLDVLRVHLPPLRKRKRDIRVLFFHFLRNYEKKYGSINGITESALRYLENYDYPGNIRELQNIVERAVVLYRGKTIQQEDIKRIIDQNEIDIEPVIEKSEHNSALLGFAELQAHSEKEIILRALEKNGFNRKKAAKELGINRATLWRKMKKYNIP